jgi:hypothetical protein
VTGGERIGWEQQAPGRGALTDLGFALFVDDVRTELSDVRCTRVARAEAFTCTAVLPAMARGAHTLQVSAFRRADQRAESARSDELSVIARPPTLAAATSAVASTPLTGLSERTLNADGVELQLKVLTAGLDRPLDLAIAPDGRIFVAERSSVLDQGAIQIRVVHPDGALAAPAARLGDAWAGGHDPETAAAIAIDPSFARTGFVFAGYPTRFGVQVVRMRSVNDELIDRVVLLDRLPLSVSRPSIALRFGADGKLYLAVGDGDAPERAADLGSFNGKILRLNADASTPRDQRALSPVYALHFHAPRAIAPLGDGALWVADSGALSASSPTAGGSELRAIAGDRGRGETVARYRLPDRVTATGVAIGQGSVDAVRGNVFVSSLSGILRLRQDPAVPFRLAASEWLLTGVPGGFRALAVDERGTLHAVSEHALITVTPVARPPGQTR